MDVRRYTLDFEVQVDPSTTFGSPILDPVVGCVGKFLGDIDRQPGISLWFAKLDDEGEPQGDNDPPKADNTLG